MLRSGLCHGPDCQEKITDESESEDFHSQACQARWQAALVGAQPDLGLLGVPIVWRRPCAPPLRPAAPEGVEALRPDLSLGARHHLTGGEYEVTESEAGRAVLTPVEGTWLSMLLNGNVYISKLIRRSWRRNG